MRQTKSSKELLEKFNEIEKELTPIFYELLNSNISLEKKSLLRKKTLLLLKKGYQAIIITEENKTNIKSDEKVKIDPEKLLNIGLLVRLGGALILFFAPMVSFVIQIVGIGIEHYARSKNTDVDLYSEDLIKRANELTILYGNCIRRLGIEIENVYVEDNDKKIDNMDLANEVILEYINTGNYKETNKEVEELVIKILKYDLKNNSVDIKELLELAKIKIEKENLKEGINKKLIN